VLQIVIQKYEHWLGDHFIQQKQHDALEFLLAFDKSKTEIPSKLFPPVELNCVGLM
jgi:hypothetical protein